MKEKITRVCDYLSRLQGEICSALSEVDGKPFGEDNWQHRNGSGGGCTRVLANGEVIEKGGVLFSHVRGSNLPPAATQKRPDLAGKDFSAMGVSLVIHPLNPFAPTSHMNVRFFVAGADSADPVWWFGGGFDLTPFYGFKEDARHWHHTARKACEDFGAQAYPTYKDWCDDYFFLPHRDEARGIGGLFFDDFNKDGFERSFAFMQSVGDHYLPAYLPILRRRKDTPHQQHHRDWQLLRRGRYVEFNLVYDRGTLFGLQSGGRTESILVSMPPHASWAYRAEPIEGTEEHRLLTEYLPRQDWI